MSKALTLHKKLKGKFSIKPKTTVNRKTLSLVYTPGVADVCEEISKHKNSREYTIRSNMVGVVTDGSSVLGLGDIGPYAALPVMEGKCLLFKKFANVDAFPICLGTQDKDEIVELVNNIKPSFGAIMLEDIEAPQCFEIEDKLQGIGIPVIHDDQHGTAIAVLAGLINAAKVVKKDVEKLRVTVVGAGSAGTAITKLLLDYGIRDIIVCDSKGPLYKGRDKMNDIKKDLAKKTNKDKLKTNLDDAIYERDAIVGVSRPNIITAKMIASMRSDPIIFALSNPKPEIMPDLAKKGGAKVIATGRSDFPNQINNALVFPGLFRGLLDANAKKITTKEKIKASEALASVVKKPKSNNIIPSIFNKNVVKKISKAVSG